jgi:hypothetical protein
VRDTTTSVRLSTHQLAAIDTAAARASQIAGRKITRNDLMLEAAMRAVAEQGVSIEDPHATLPLPFEPPVTGSGLLAAGSDPRPQPASAPEPPRPGARQGRRTEIADVDVVRLPARR